jgi:hypothetical protein
MQLLIGKRLLIHDTANLSKQQARTNNDQDWLRWQKKLLQTELSRDWLINDPYNKILSYKKLDMVHESN